MIYVGVTANLKERVLQHKNGMGSEFTRKYNIKFLMYFEEFIAIDQAIAREKQLKNWRREWKWNLVKSQNPDLKDIFEDLM